jgi:hypothetical protein
MTVEATSPSGTPVSFVASAVDRVDGVVPVTCSPTSGSLFPFGATIVHCNASDSHGNEATGAFTVTVTAADTPGLMLGIGFIAAPGQRHDFAFLVGENGTEGGALEYVVHVREGWRERQDRFRTTAVTSVSFFDAPGTAPGPLPQPTIDQVVFSGVGTWNGTAGYTFTAQALDAGEPGRGRDMFAISVRDSAGHLVASVNARISLGNVESYFVPR